MEENFGLIISVVESCFSAPLLFSNENLLESFVM